MNKKELIKFLKIDYSTRGNAYAIENFIDRTLEIISLKLRMGESVTLVGFGKFSVRNRKERIGHNPRTGKPIKIATTKQVHFLPGSGLKKLVRGK
jgi:nucleoid DNA-binding protein